MSQETQILTHLAQGHSITPLEALNKFGCFRLASRINSLRKIHNIKDRWIESNGKRFKSYFIPAKQHTQQI